MKILSAEQIRAAEAYTIVHEPICSIDLMERTALGCVNWIEKHFSSENQVVIFCGKGNNGGDGLAIARLLFLKGYNVHCYIVHYSENGSPDFQKNLNRSKELSISIDHLHSTSDLDSIPKGIIIDAIFGSGLNKSITGFTAELIEKINSSLNVIVSIDIPSGLYCEKNSTDNLQHTVKADHTLTFELPKLSFLVPESGQYVGDWEIIQIGLSPIYIEQCESPYFYITEEFIQSKIKIRSRFSHKGTYGHALIVAGSYGKMGAAVLSTRSVLRSGAGLVTAYIPYCGYTIMQISVPEAMVQVAPNEKELAGLPDLSGINAIAIGPGIGKSQCTVDSVHSILKNTTVPLVLDADALNILSDHSNWFEEINVPYVLTPHPKEFERLFGKTDNTLARIQLQHEKSLELNCQIVLKGAYSTIACPDGKIYFNSSGNSGMATAGSGDVLTGIITGLIATGYSVEEAAIIGPWLHGKAGDLAIENSSMESLLASDIICHLSKVFISLKKDPKY